MNKSEIERIALEVAHRGCTTYHHQPVEHGEKYMFSEQHMLDFATRFLSRIDDERGKEAVDYTGICTDGGHLCISRGTKGLKVNSIQPLFLSPTPTIPDGYVLVPIKSTTRMERAAANGEGRSTGANMESYSLIWDDMLQAAQGECK